ncbi:hypothetical protein [Teredinibacter turnerae]|uniref:hypothetical protein n=1 Tax=Teredinibacter turnerae TaxID=2426 RepID=UPI00035E64B7|nr:hypothetical protein [Teredinibacter turnerae]
MKPIKTKAEIRNEIEEQIAQYIAGGGAVEKIPTGQSGNVTNANLFANATTFEPKKDRTLVTDVIKSVDERRKQKPTTPLKKSSQPRKKLITDDFGEPVRWVWVEN